MTYQDLSEKQNRKSAYRRDMRFYCVWDIDISS